MTRAMGTTNIDSGRFSESMCILDWQPFQYAEQRGYKEKVTPSFYTRGLREQEKGDQDSLGVTPKLTQYWEKNAPQFFATASHATSSIWKCPSARESSYPGTTSFMC